MRTPVGRRFGWGDDPRGVEYDTEIMGVAKDASHGNLREKPRRLIYFPNTGGNVLQIRTAAHPPTMVGSIRRETQAVDKTLRADSVYAMTHLVDRELAREKLVAKVSSFCGALALLLAALGLYGLMAYEVLRRTQEIGICVAPGATRFDFVRMVLRETLTLVRVRLAIGVPAALSLVPIVSSMLFGIMPRDPVMISMAVLVMSVVALAGYLPARHASLVEPLGALRRE
jgi:ABC-type antimicrobial peptide transport system permease subunit